jgi:hypothetical protein
MRNANPLVRNHHAAIVFMTSRRTNKRSSLGQSLHHASSIFYFHRLFHPPPSILHLPSCSQLQTFRLLDSISLHHCSLRLYCDMLLHQAACDIPFSHLWFAAVEASAARVSPVVRFHEGQLDDTRGRWVMILWIRGYRTT